MRCTRSRHACGCEKIVSGEEHPSQHLWVEQLLPESDPSSLDRLGRTALMVAAFSGHLKVRGVTEGRSPAGGLHQGWHSSHCRRAQLDARNEDSFTALTCAVGEGQLQRPVIASSHEIKGTCRSRTS